jgi:hypothetical protein
MADDAQTAFVGELEREIAQYSRWGKMNNLSDIALTMVSIVGSIAAAVVAAGVGPKYVAAGLAALPAACTSYQRMAQLRERASLHFEYAAAITGLAARVKYANGPDLEKFAAERAAVVITREQRWSDALRRGGAAPAQTPSL